MGDLSWQHGQQEERLNGPEPHRKKGPTGRLTSQVDHQGPFGCLCDGLHCVALGRDVGELPGVSWRREAEEQGQLPDGLAGVDGGLGHILRQDLQAKPNQDPRKQQG